MISLLSGMAGAEINRLLVSALILCSICSLAVAQLTWSKQRKKIDAGPGRAMFPEND